MSKKQRKPKLLHMNGQMAYLREDKRCPIGLIFGYYSASLNEAKRLHEWLGRAIKYLEARKGNE